MLAIELLNDSDYADFIAASASRQAEDRAWANGGSFSDELKELQEMIPLLLPQAQKTKEHYFRKAILEETGEPVGVVWFGIFPGMASGTIVLLDIVVGKTLRGRGFGNLILRQMLPLLKKEGYSSVLLNVRTDNLAAIHLYEKIGFIRQNIAGDIKFLEMSMAL